MEDLIQRLVVVNTTRDAYLNDAASAASLCKKSGGKRKKEVGYTAGSLGFNP